MTRSALRITVSLSLVLLTLQPLATQWEASAAIINNEGACGIVFQLDDGETEYSKVDGLQVMPLTTTQGFFATTFNADRPIEVTAILCERDLIVPHALDFMVLEAGYAFYISVTDRDGGERVGVLEQPNGTYRFRIVEGRVNQEESDAIRDRMADFNQ